MNDASTTPTPADLARELIRLDEAATSPVLWFVEHCHSQATDDDDAMSGLGWALDGMPKAMDETFAKAADAKFIQHAARHARTIAEALLAAEWRVAGLERVAVVAGETCGELNAAYLEMNRLRERLAAAEADNATLAKAFAERVGELGTRLAAAEARHASIVAELERLAEENAALKAELAALRSQLSRIDYAFGEPNEMRCSPYDIDLDGERVVRQVEAMKAENAKLTEGK